MAPRHCVAAEATGVQMDSSTSRSTCTPDGEGGRYCVVLYSVLTVHGWYGGIFCLRLFCTGQVPRVCSGVIPSILLLYIFNRICMVWEYYLHTTNLIPDNTSSLYITEWRCSEIPPHTIDPLRIHVCGLEL